MKKYLDSITNITVKHKVKFAVIIYFVGFLWMSHSMPGSFENHNCPQLECNVSATLTLVLGVMSGKSNWKVS